LKTFQGEWGIGRPQKNKAGLAGRAGRRAIEQEDNYNNFFRKQLEAVPCEMVRIHRRQLGKGVNGPGIRSLVDWG